ncbi:hypothetical protein GGR57DRAFT_498304 [Xylariaceae sp. FL1272]|nr:hypothetical protein GGR57DRAFT_498304 [Xylariaceae sp. FL1272]
MTSIQQLLLPEDELPENPTAKGKCRLSANPNGSGSNHFVIEYVHDTICPFCYIGWKTLLKAIEEYKSRDIDAVFEVTCSPFILGPTAGISAYTKLDYYIMERGLPADRIELWTRLGSDVGVNFRWQGRTGNSRNSHKMLRFALEAAPTTRSSAHFTRLARGLGPPPIYPPSSLRAPEHAVQTEQCRGPDLQMRLLDRLTYLYHETDRDISDPTFLREETAFVTGFSHAEIQAVLDSEEWDRAIDKLDNEIQRRTAIKNPGAGPIIAVPTMVINHRWVYGGFQKVDFLVRQFEMLARGQEPSTEYTRSQMVPVVGVKDSLHRENMTTNANANANVGGSTSAGPLRLRNSQEADFDYLVSIPQQQASKPSDGGKPVFGL